MSPSAARLLYTMCRISRARLGVGNLGRSSKDCAHRTARPLKLHFSAEDVFVAFMNLTMTRCLSGKARYPPRPPLRPPSHRWLHWRCPISACAEPKVAGNSNDVPSKDFSRINLRNDLGLLTHVHVRNRALNGVSARMMCGRAGSRSNMFETLRVEAPGTGIRITSDDLAVHRRANIGYSSLYSSLCQLCTELLESPIVEYPAEPARWPPAFRA